MYLVDLSSKKEGNLTSHDGPGEFAGRFSHDSLPLVSCLGFSMDAEGLFTRERVDLFGNVAWDATRIKVQQKADEWRRQGFIGAPMASHAELAYAGIVETLAALEKEFILRREQTVAAKA